MGARTKLNEIHAIMAVIIAAAAGVATGSWIVSGVTLAVLLAAKMHSGAIRSRRRKP
jgi:hypothetical protein